MKIRTPNKSINTTGTSRGAKLVSSGWRVISAVEAVRKGKMVVQ